jgi:hypothetical protein
MRVPGSTSLTAHLARAAGGTKSDHPSLGSAQGTEIVAEASSTIVLEEHSDRCTVSVARGQRCSRTVRPGQTVCAGHAAMAMPADAPIPVPVATRRRR